MTKTGRLWVKQVKGHRVEKDLVLPCERGEVRTVLREAMHEMDLSEPMWLKRHQSDWAQYGLTRFLPEHFMESVPFDRLEISYIAPDDEKKKKAMAEFD